MPESSGQTKTWLFDNIEVVLTGRKANRKLKNDKVDERIEIQPAAEEEGTWKKWVRQSDLYEIEQE